jgi:hypothetical protein
MPESRAESYAAIVSKLKHLASLSQHDLGEHAPFTRSDAPICSACDREPTGSSRRCACHGARERVIAALGRRQGTRVPLPESYALGYSSSRVRLSCAFTKYPRSF